MYVDCSTTQRYKYFLKTDNTQGVLNVKVSLTILFSNNKSTKKSPFVLMINGVY